MASKVKQKPCKICRDQFTPFKSTDPVCAKYECRVAFAEDHVRKSQEKRLKAQRKETKAKLLEMKPKSYWLGKLERVFNRYIVLRDANDPCISCGTTKPVQYAAGHYKTKGAHPELRFDESNVHKQCNKYCNKELSGNIVNYRPRLLKKIGESELDRIEGYNPPKHYTIDDIKQLIADYKAKIKEMEA